MSEPSGLTVEELIHLCMDREEGFLNFIRMLWRWKQRPPPDRIQEQICRFLGQRTGYDMVQAFRGVGKSSIVAGLCGWLHLQNKELKILVLSKTAPFARDWTAMVLNDYRSFPLLQHLAPGAGDRSQSDGFDIPGSTREISASLYSRGIGSQITGHRADIVILDDVETKENAVTVTAREKLARDIEEVSNIVRPGPWASVIYLGTPQTEDSYYARLPEMGCRVRKWPIVYPSKEFAERESSLIYEELVEDLRKNPRLEGTPCEPVRFGVDVIAQRRSRGRITFALQNLLDVTDATAQGSPLRCENVPIVDMEPGRAHEWVAWGKSPELLLRDLPCLGRYGDAFYRASARAAVVNDYKNGVMAIDPAAGGGDELAAVCVAVHNATLYCCDVYGTLRRFTEDDLVAMVRRAIRWKMRTIVTETNFGMGVLSQLLVPIVERECRRAPELFPLLHTEPWKIVVDPDGVRARGQKERRIIDTLSPVIDDHRIAFHRGVIEEDYRHALEHGQEYSLVYQMTHIQRIHDALPHDDRVDALAMAVGYLAQSMSADTQLLAKRNEERVRWAEIEEKRAGIGRRRKREGVWAVKKSSVDWIGSFRDT